MLGGGSDPPSGWNVHARGCRQHVLSFPPPPGDDFGLVTGLFFACLGCWYGNTSTRISDFEVYTTHLAHRDTHETCVCTALRASTACETSSRKVAAGAASSASITHGSGPAARRAATTESNRDRIEMIRSHHDSAEPRNSTYRRGGRP